MHAGKFAAMLSDKHIIDLKKMQHKYSPAEVAEMMVLLQKNIFTDLPLWPRLPSGGRHRRWEPMPS